MTLWGSPVKDTKIGGNSETGNKRHEKYWFNYKQNHMLGSGKSLGRLWRKPIKMKNELIHQDAMDSPIEDVEW